MATATTEVQQTKFEDFRMTQKLGEGTFSEVLKVKNKTNGKIYAMKRFRKRFNSTFEEIQNLREIQALRRLNPHPHVIDLIEVIFDQKHGVLALNFELMECNLYELISRKSMVINETKAKNYFYQICKALDYMHGKGIFHRDIKPENILVKDTTIKLADFGSCRGIHSKQPYTEYIATRWYRSPECLLCDGIYTYKMDLWGAGCVLYEIISKLPLFPGTNELDQLNRIHNVVGTPSPKLIKRMLGPRANAPEYNFPPKDGSGIRSLLPHVTNDCIELVKALLIYDPDTRISSREALRHVWFKECVANDTARVSETGSVTKISSARRSRTSLTNVANTTDEKTSSSTYLKKATNVPTTIEHVQVVSGDVTAPVHVVSIVPKDKAHEESRTSVAKKSQSEQSGGTASTNTTQVHSEHRPSKVKEPEKTLATTKTHVPGHVNFLPSVHNTHPSQIPVRNDNSDSLSNASLSTTTTNNTVKTNMTTATASTYYTKIKKQNDERLALEVAMARARRAAKKNPRGSASKNSNVSLNSSKGSWNTSLNHVNKTSTTKLPTIPSVNSGNAYKLEKQKVQSTNFPMLNINGIHQEKRKPEPSSKKDYFTLPSIGTDKSALTAIAIGKPSGTGLPSIKRDYR